jgi:hypothetical protein
MVAYSSKAREHIRDQASMSKWAMMKYDPLHRTAIQPQSRYYQPKKQLLGMSQQLQRPLMMDKLSSMRATFVKEYPKRALWGLAFAVLAIILGLSLGLAMTSHSSFSKTAAAEDLRDLRYIQPLEEQDILDICHCTGDASGLVLVDNEELLYGVLGGNYIGGGLIDQIYARDSCALENMVMLSITFTLSITNFQRYGLDLDSSIGFITGEPELTNHPNHALVVGYGIDVVIQQFIVKLFYLSTGGDYWDRCENWLKTGLVCDFEGVSCGLMERIQFIQLPSNNLNGTIPWQVSRLPFLRSLDLSSNPNLVGTLPTELGGMKLIWTSVPPV